MQYWQDTFQPSDSDVSLIVSILSVGTFVGALSAGILADLTGRKYGIVLSCLIPFNLGVALQTAATAQPMFIAGRFIAGLGGMHHSSTFTLIRWLDPTTKLL